jgi:hypothetical protein
MKHTTLVRNDRESDGASSVSTDTGWIAVGGSLAPLAFYASHSANRHNAGCGGAWLGGLSGSVGTVYPSPWQAFHAR